MRLERFWKFFDRSLSLILRRKGTTLTRTNGKTARIRGFFARKCSDAVSVQRGHILYPRMDEKPAQTCAFREGDSDAAGGAAEG